jgi:hypothetical protein
MAFKSDKQRKAMFARIKSQYPLTTNKVFKIHSEIKESSGEPVATRETVRHIVDVLEPKSQRFIGSGQLIVIDKKNRAVYDNLQPKPGKQTLLKVLRAVPKKALDKNEKLEQIELNKTEESLLSKDARLRKGIKSITPFKDRARQRF